MKKISLIICVITCIFLLAACGDKGETSSNNEPANNTNNRNTVSSDYQSANIEQSIDDARLASGIYVKFVVSEKTSTDEGSSAVVAFGASQDKYYILSENSETYIDLTSDEYMVIYTQDDSGSFSTERLPYSKDYSKENAKAAVQGYYMVFKNYASMYDTISTLPATKSQVQILGRSCDQYKVTQEYAIGVSVEYTLAIDQETSMCLKWEVSGTAAYISGTATFECTEFKTNYTVELPQVE